MALSKQIATPYGVLASYWKITHLNLNRIDGSADLVVSGYYDRYTRENGSQAMKELEYHVSPEIFLQLSQNIDPQVDIVASGYEFLKQQPEFIFAEDC